MYVHEGIICHFLYDVKDDDMVMAFEDHDDANPVVITASITPYMQLAFTVKTRVGSNAFGR